MTDKRARHEGRRSGPSFVQLPHACLNHANYTALSPHAVKLLIDIYGQYKGNNNGDLCCTWSMMQKRGWRSKDTLNKAVKELIHYGWIELTRQGGRKVANLYAVTFQSIHECGGKLDVKPTRTASGIWRQNKQPYNENKNGGKKLNSLTRLPGHISTATGPKANKLTLI